MATYKEQFFLFLGYDKREDDTNYWHKIGEENVTILFDREDNFSFRWLMEMYMKINNTFPYTMHIEGDTAKIFKEEDVLFFAQAKDIDNIDEAMNEVISAFLEKEVKHIYSLIEMTNWLEENFPDTEIALQISKRLKTA